MFITNLSEDPFRGQFILGVLARAGIGKTTLITDLARKIEGVPSQYVFIVSVDRGLSRIRLHPQPYQGRLLPIYIAPTPEEAAADAANGVPFSFLGCMRKRLHTICVEKIPNLLAKGVTPDRIWLVIDTMTHLQRKLLLEGQEAQIEAADGLRGTRAANKKTKKEAIRDDLIQTVDWGINLNVMTSVTDYVINNANCNIVWSFLESGDKDYKEKYRATIAIQGASHQKLLGDLDVLLYMRQATDNSRVLETRPTLAWEAKDRYNVLPQQIPFLRVEDGAERPTLLAVRDMIFNGVRFEPQAQ